MGGYYYRIGAVCFDTGGGETKLKLRGIQMDEEKIISDARLGTGDIYFIQFGDGGPIKIGITNSVERRLKNLQSASPIKLNLLGTIKNGGTQLEEKLHIRFNRSRINGEWFNPSKSLIKFIKETKKPNYLNQIKIRQDTIIEIQDELRIDTLANKAIETYERTIKKDIQNGMDYNKIRLKWHISRKYYDMLRDHRIK